MFYNFIEQPRIIFGGLSAAGLKVNAPKLSFGLKEITYLGYVITREGIKPNPEKVQGIIDIRRPMVQYYRYMFPKRYHILAPLTEASSGSKGRKILWNYVFEESLRN